MVVTFDAVNMNQTTNITCSVPYTDATRWNESDFILLLPDGTERDADYFIEYEYPSTVEYIFPIVADSSSATYICTGVNVNTSITATVTAFGRLTVSKYFCRNKIEKN